MLLADEPTGNLDPVTASYVFEALAALVKQSGLAALIATHNHELAARMDRRVTLADGKVVPLGLRVQVCLGACGRRPPGCAFPRG